MSKSRVRCRRVTLVFGLIAMASVIGSCRQKADETQVSEVVNATDGRPGLCVAVRGNGNWISTHFTSLARIMEWHGPIEGIAGGSSASITAFLYESMLVNTQIDECQAGPCTKSEKGARLSLLFKSLLGYYEFLAGRAHEIHALMFPEAVDGVPLERAVALAKDPAALAKISATLNRERGAASLINRDLVEFLSDDTVSSDYRVQEVKEAFAVLQKFAVVDQRPFFRPGVLNFEGDGLPHIVARIADLLAGYHYTESDEQHYRRFLDVCSTAAVGKTWAEINTAKAGALAPCGTLFSDWLSGYRDRRVGLELTGSLKTRVDDVMGAKLPVFVSTSVIEGRDVVSQYRDARNRFLKGDGSAAIGAPLDRLKVGYWMGGVPSQSRFRTELRKFESGDIKVQKFENLGAHNVEWKTPLRFSPAEPGLSPLKPISDDKLSAGGWIDLHPVQVLRAAGCEKVIYVTRQDSETKLATGVGAYFGMDESAAAKFYGLDPSRKATDNSAISSFQRAIDLADGIWCTEWNRFTGDQVVEMAEESYQAKYVTRDTCLKRAAKGYKRIVENGPLGCNYYQPQKKAEGVCVDF